MFWTVKGSTVRGKARPLSHFGFPIWVRGVEAAVHIVKTGRTLFFMHDIYWRYGISQDDLFNKVDFLHGLYL